MGTIEHAASCGGTAHAAAHAANVDTDGEGVQGYYYAPDGGHHRGAPVPNTQTGNVGQFSATRPFVQAGGLFGSFFTMVPATGDAYPDYHPLVR